MPNNISGHAVEALRDWQSEAPVVGPFFRDCYTFLDWLGRRMFDAQPPPVSLRVGKLRHRRMAEYSPADGSMLPTITIDVTKTKSAVDVLEWLAHELIHHYQWSTGLMIFDMEENHNDEFQELSMDLGLAIEPKTGIHRGYVGDIWQRLLGTFYIQAHVDMSQHELPGPQEPERRLHKWTCSECGFSFRTRRQSVMVMCWGEKGQSHVPQEMEMVE